MKNQLQLAEGLSAAAIHTHTIASDGMVTGEQLVLAAAAAEIPVLCITDHDCISTTPKLVEFAAEHGVELIYAEEVTAKFPPGIHIVGMFLEKPIRMHMSVEDTIDAIHDHGGLATFAHPFMPTWFASITPKTLRRVLEHRKIDGIELRHTAPVLPGTWAKLDKFYAEHKEQIGAALGAGDSHYGELDIARMVTTFPGKTAADFRKAVEEKTTAPLDGIPYHRPSLRMMLGQQRRSLIELNHARKHGLIGQGEGPIKNS